MRIQRLTLLKLSWDNLLDFMKLFIYIVVNKFVTQTSM